MPDERSEPGCGASIRARLRAMTPSLPPTVAAHVPTGLLVGGTWRPASGGATFPVHDPGTTQVLFDVADGTSEDALAALTAADEAFAEYRTVAPYQRSELLRAVYESITARTDPTEAGS